MATTMDVGQRIPTNSERSNPLSSPNQSTKEDHPTNNSIHPSANCINENLRFFFFLFFFFLWRFLSYHGEHVVKQHDGPVNKVERRRTSSRFREEHGTRQNESAGDDRYPYDRRSTGFYLETISRGIWKTLLATTER